jgi:hypothetical protein
MKIYSLFRNVILRIDLVICIVVAAFFCGCYSFTGGSTIPSHIKTLYISSVNDLSGYGNPNFRNILMQNLIDKFKKDNSFEVVERNGNAKLNVSINTIREEALTISPGELERERKINVSCEVEYYDVVKKKQIWKKTFSNSQVYELALAQVGRDEAIRVALDQISDDTLLAVVSGW